MSAKILIVEDDDAISTGLALNLKISGHVPTIAQDGDQAQTMIEEHDFDLILLDINLPKKDGLALMGDLRRRGDRTPIIMVSARGDEYDKVAALRLGADDYVTKPFSLAELMARVDAVLRRTGTAESGNGGAPSLVAMPGTDVPGTEARTDELSFADVVIDPDTRTVTRGAEDIKLTRLEFELLLFLLRNPSRVFARDELLRKVWGQHSGSKRTIDNFVAQLRGKLEHDPESPRHFITVRGSGYRFDP